MRKDKLTGFHKNNKATDSSYCITKGRPNSPLSGVAIVMPMSCDGEAMGGCPGHSMG